MKNINCKNVFVTLWIIYVLLIVKFSFASNTLAPNNISKEVAFFEGSWNEVLAIAKKENKPVFVKVYADWCLPCKHMEQTVFTFDKIVDYYNNNFINYKIDVESIEGSKFKHKYNVSAIPDLLFFDINGQLTHRDAGQKNMQELLAMAQNVIVEKDNEDHLLIVRDNRGAEKEQEPNLNSMQRQYDAGFRKPRFLYDFAYLLKQQNVPYNQVVDDYLVKCKRVKDEKTMKLVYDFANDLDSRAIDILIKNKDVFSEKYGVQHIRSKIKSAIVSTATIAISSREDEFLKKMKKVIQKSGLPDAKEFEFNMLSSYYDGIHDVEKYTKVLRKYMKKYDGKDAGYWHLMSSKLMTASESKKNLKTAKKWIEHSIYLHPQYYNYESYAYVLKMLGKRQKALSAARKAIAIAQKEGVDYSALYQLFKKELPTLPATNVSDQIHSVDVSKI